MPPTASPPQPLAVERAPWLRGSIRVPGDGLLSHLALSVAAIAFGESTIARAPASDAIAGLVDALRQFGVRASIERDRWHVRGMGVAGLLEPLQPLELRDSPLGLQLLMGLAGGLDFPTTLRGDTRFSRESDELVAQLGELGVSVLGGQPGRTPITLRGPAVMVPAQLALPSAAPGARAALLLAALNARGVGRFTDALPAEGHAERMLATFGASVRTLEGNRLELDGLPELRARDIIVPGDPGLAAMVATAAAIVPGSEVVVESVLLDPPRVAVFSALVAMGAGVTLHNAREVGGERIADVVARHQPLHGNSFAERFMALLADDLPLLAAAAAVADGDTSFVLPDSLALLHRGRLTDLAAAFRALGIQAMVADNEFIVRGNPVVAGGERLPTGGDPAIALAGLALGMIAERGVTIDDRRALDERFPGFAPVFEELGASFSAEGAMP